MDVIFSGSFILSLLSVLFGYTLLSKQSTLLKDIPLFVYNCFLKPFRASDPSDQQQALESFYKGQAHIYDSTRKSLLKGRDIAVTLGVKHLKKSSNIIWVDIGAGTGSNVEEMLKTVPISCFKAIYLVDLSPSLCEIARQRCAAHNWQNVHVVCINSCDFQLPDNSQADLITFSYSLSMIPAFYAAVTKAKSLLHPDGIIAVVDFYVQTGASTAGRASTLGGELSRHVSWLPRTFWRVWFELDRVFLDSARRDFLEHEFGTVKSLNLRNKPLGQIPYYIWIGCDKTAHPELLHRLNAYATESPYLGPQGFPERGNASGRQTGDTVWANSPISAGSPGTLDPKSSPMDLSSAESSCFSLAPRSKALDAALANEARNLPYPTFFYQKETWRVFYDDQLPQYHQFASQYIYAFTWEDPKVDHDILSFQPSDTVLAITSAGDNILAYAALPNPPRRLHAVDLNPHQNHLLELKLAALRKLSYNEFWKLFGEGKHEAFMDLLFTKLAPHLSSQALQFWAKQGPSTFSPDGRGLYDTGSTRWALRLARWVIRLARAEDAVARMCAARDLAEQTTIWRQEVRPALFHPVVTQMMIANPVFLWKALGVPGNQTSMIDGSLLEYVVNTLDPVVEKSLLKSDNYFYYLCLKGCYSPENCPDYLTKQGFARLSAPDGPLDNIRIHTDYINDVLERLSPRSLTCAIVMDHMDWFEPSSDAARTEVKHHWRALAPGGRVLLRSAAKRPWYIDVFEQEGFVCRPAAVRIPGECIDRINMYASTWVCTKDREVSLRRVSGLEI